MKDSYNINHLLLESEKCKRFQDSLSPFIGQRTYDENTLRNIREAAISNCPCELSEYLQEMRGEKSATGAILVTWPNLNIDMPSAFDRKDIQKNRLIFLPEVEVLGIASILGEPLAYRAEKDGALIQHVFPIRSEQNVPSNESSDSMLDLHTELVYSARYPHRPLNIDSPDFVLLSCLRSDPNGEATTLIANIKEMCLHLKQEQLAMLRQPRFELQAPYSFTRNLGGDRPWVGPVPIISDVGTRTTSAFDLACGTRGLDSEADKSLEALRAAAKLPGVTKQIALQAGDLLILDNRRCAHGRTPFVASYDQFDRWLLRIYVRRSLDGMRPLDPDLSPRVF